MNRFLIAVGLLLALPPAQGCPTQLPRGLQVAAVGEHIVVNGLPVAINQVTARDGAPAVLTRVEKQWKDDGYRVNRSIAAGWNVLSALDDNCMTTLQLVDRGGAFGYIAYSRLNQIRALEPHASGVPVPSGASITSSVVSKDDGRKGSVVTLTSTQSVADLSLFYMQRLTEEKWVAVHAEQTGDRKGTVHTSVVSAQRGRERIAVAIWRSVPTQIVVNQATGL